LFPKKESLRSLKTSDVLSQSLPIPFISPYFIKYYPSNSVKIINGKFKLTKIGKLLLKNQLKIKELYKEYKLLSNLDPRTIELKSIIQDNGFKANLYLQVNNAINIQDFKKGKTQYILASDLSLLHSPIQCKLSQNVVNMKTYECQDADFLLKDNLVNEKLTQDSVYTLLWASLKKTKFLDKI